MERAGWEAAWASGVPVTLHVLPGETGFMGAHRTHPPLQMVYVLFYMCVLHVCFTKLNQKPALPTPPAPLGFSGCCPLSVHTSHATSPVGTLGSRRGLRRKELAQQLRWPWVNKPGSSTFLPSGGVSPCPSAVTSLPQPPCILQEVWLCCPGAPGFLAVVRLPVGRLT